LSGVVCCRDAYEVGDNCKGNGEVVKEDELVAVLVLVLVIEIDGFELFIDDEKVAM
jgi:hypothetical protein